MKYLLNGSAVGAYVFTFGFAAAKSDGTMFIAAAIFLGISIWSFKDLK